MLEAGTYIGNPLPGKPMTWTVTVPAGWIGYEGWAVFTDVPEGDPGVFVGGPDGERRHPRGLLRRERGTAPADVGGRAHRGRPGSRRLDRLGAGRTSLGGYSGTRIDLEVPADVTCENGSDYMVLSSRMAGDCPGPVQPVQLWVLDVEGRPLVVMRNSFADTPAELMSQADDILDSIVITP